MEGGPSDRSPFYFARGKRFGGGGRDVPGPERHLFEGHGDRGTSPQGQCRCESGMALDGTPPFLDVLVHILQILKRGVGVPPQGGGGLGRRCAFGDVPRSPWPSGGCRSGPGTSLPPSASAGVCLEALSFPLERHEFGKAVEFFLPEDLVGCPRIQHRAQGIALGLNSIGAMRPEGPR